MASYLKCPHCGYRLRTRNSVGVHPLLRTAYLQCMQFGCGAQFNGQREILQQLSSSSVANPYISLPDMPRSECERVVIETRGKNPDQLDLLNTPSPGEPQ